jgi:hypothetical protein
MLTFAPQRQTLSQGKEGKTPTVSDIKNPA